VYSVLKIIDKLGRVVIPKEFRDFYCLNINDKLELIPTEQGILIKKQSLKND